jgi:hypothetical protein
MYRVSYTVEARAANRSPTCGRTRRTEYFGAEPEALARVRQLLEDGRCIAVAREKGSARLAGALSDL